MAGLPLFPAVRASGVYFALRVQEEEQLRSAGSDAAVREMLQEEVEEAWDTDWLVETDKAWDTIDPRLGGADVRSLGKVVLGGHQ